MSSTPGPVPRLREPYVEASAATADGDLVGRVSHGRHHPPVVAAGDRTWRP